MKLIFSGTSDSDSYQVVKNAVEWSGVHSPDEVVLGAARGTDVLGELWANKEGVELKNFEADWECKGKAAGPIRNKKMARYADRLLAIWDGKNAGTRSMIQKAYEEDISVDVYLTESPPDNDLMRGELLRRFPEIDSMETDVYRESTIDAFLTGCPTYFWELPTSSTAKYHSEDEVSEHGNWLHTKRVFSAYQDVSRSLVEGGVISERDREAGMAAALLHDLVKYGYPKREGEHTIDYHDVLSASFIRQFKDLPEKVARLVNVHNGDWQSGPVPENTHEWSFHQSDLIASRRHNNIGISGPVPDEIREISDSIEVK